MTRAATRILTPLEAERAVYFDFEGTSTDAPTLVGFLRREDHGEACVFEQHILEAALTVAAVAEPNIPRNAARHRLLPSSMTKSLAELAKLAQDEHRLLVAWSSYEASVVTEYCSDPAVRRALLANLVDAKQIARRWKARMHPEVRFVRDPWNGTHSLAAYLNLIEYTVPTAFGPKLTGSRIRAVRTQLASRQGSYDSLTPTAKAKWTKMLMHNWHDCNGLRELTCLITTA